MNLYSCLVIGAGNLLVTRQEFEAATDQDAMARARELFRDAPIAPHNVERFEVWGGTRRIAPEACAKQARSAGPSPQLVMGGGDHA